MKELPEIFVGQRFRTRFDVREIVGIVRNERLEANILWQSVKRNRNDYGVSMISVIVDAIRADQAGDPVDG